MPKPGLFDSIPYVPPNGYGPQSYGRKPSLWDNVEQVSYGVGDGAVNQLAAMQQMVQHPVNTARGLFDMGRNALMDPVGTGSAVAGFMGNQFNTAASSPYGFGKVLGENIGLRPMPRNALAEHIVSPELAKQLKYPVSLPTDEAFHAAVRNTPGAEITPDGVRLKISRKQLPDQEGAESIRTGVFYLPTGSKNMRHYDGTSGYGGMERFDGETLLKNPLFVKGGTGGKAPEAAYDAIKGKGAMKKLDSEIMSVVHDSAIRKDPQLYVTLVQRLLKDNGADPGLASEIIRNSTKGNTLRYALQENIIAHTVRNAGYDGVLGHTTTKSGPAFSELFDVRELTYPARMGGGLMDPDIHHKFAP